MNDLVFVQALFWFLLQKPVVLYSVGLITSIVACIGLLLIVRRWGEGF